MVNIIFTFRKTFQMYCSISSIVMVVLIKSFSAVIKEKKLCIQLMNSNIINFIKINVNGCGTIFSIS